MRRLIPAVALICALFGTAAARPFAEALRPEQAPAAVPGALARDVDGVETPLSEHLRGVTLLVLWAEWCPVCRAELPRIAAAARRTGAGLALLSVDTRPHAEARAAAYLAAEGLDDATALVDQDLAAARALDVTGIPHVLLVDPAGRVAGRVTGRMDWADPALDAYLGALSGD